MSEDETPEADGRVTIRVAAERLGIRSFTLIRWARRGRVQIIDQGGPYRYVSEHEIARLLASAPRRFGRRPMPDPRCHYLRIACNNEELLKFRILGVLNHNLPISAMAREIVLDEINTMLAESPRPALLAALQAYGLDQLAIDALLQSL